MQFKNSHIPFLCLVIAVIVLFGSGFIFPDLLPLSRPGYPKLQPESINDMITIHYHERPPYYVTGPLGVYGLCADPAKMVFNKAGIPFRLVKTPAKRQLDIIKANRSKDCLI